MNFLTEYGLFLAKIITVVLAIIVVLVVIMLLKARNKKQAAGELILTHPAREYQQLQQTMQQACLEPSEQKKWLKAQKKVEKLKKSSKKAGKLSEASAKPTLWLLSFKGSMDAREVEALRQEVSAILSVAKLQDEVLVQLESPGGVVHGYGLAASQLQRIRERGITLTVAIDKVAASGGYMMACVADHIVAAPFAIIGSIGVVAQIPNFNRLLKRNDIDIELLTAGQYKRTLTLFGENNQQGRDKFQQELEHTHQLFKNFVKQMRPALDIEQVATGEHWYGQQALAIKLVDQLTTSDALIISKIDTFSVVKVKYRQRKTVSERVLGNAARAVEQSLLRLWQRCSCSGL